MSHYKAKPFAIEAVRVQDAMRWAASNIESMPAWLSGATDKGTVTFGVEGAVTVRAFDGQWHPNEGDWLALFPGGEIHPLKHSVFGAMFSIDEKVE